MPAEDEPFEFFKGFSEIFVSIGLVILLTGISATLALFGGFAVLVVLPLITAAICVVVGGILHAEAADEPAVDGAGLGLRGRAVPRPGHDAGRAPMARDADRRWWPVS